MKLLLSVILLSATLIQAEANCVLSEISIDSLSPISLKDETSSSIEAALADRGYSFDFANAIIAGNSLVDKKVPPGTGYRLHIEVEKTKANAGRYGCDNIGRPFLASLKCQRWANRMNRAWKYHRFASVRSNGLPSSPSIYVAHADEKRPHRAPRGYDLLRWVSEKITPCEDLERAMKP